MEIISTPWWFDTANVVIVSAFDPAVKNKFPLRCIILDSGFGELTKFVAVDVFFHLNKMNIKELTIVSGHSHSELLFCLFQL